MLSDKLASSLMLNMVNSVLVKVWVNSASESFAAPQSRGAVCE